MSGFDVDEDLDARGQALRQAMERSAFAPEDLLCLSDDEVVALSENPRLTTTPSLVDADPEAITAARQRGIASLSERNDPYNPSDILRLTRTWRTAVLMDQWSGEHRAQLCAYLRADGYGSLENVDETGQHRFIAAKRAACLDLLVQTAVPLGERPDSTYKTERVSIEDWPEYAERTLAEARFVSVLQIIANPHQQGQNADVEPHSILVYEFPTHTVLVRTGEAFTVEHTTRSALRRDLFQLVLESFPTVDS